MKKRWMTLDRRRMILCKFLMFTCIRFRLSARLPMAPDTDKALICLDRARSIPPILLHIVLQKLFFDSQNLRHERGLNLSESTKSGNFSHRICFPSSSLRNDKQLPTAPAPFESELEALLPGSLAAQRNRYKDPSQVLFAICAHFA